MEVKSQPQTLADLPPRNNLLLPIKKVGFLGPRGGLNALEMRKKKMFLPCWKSNHNFSVHQLVIWSLRVLQYPVSLFCYT